MTTFRFLFFCTFTKRLNIEVQESNREVLEMLFHDRLVTMKEACRANMDKVPSDVKKNNIQFNIAAKQKLIMCKTAKHGTTTWSNYFVQILTNG